MARAKQISAWVEDRPGMLGQVADALGERGVSIRAFMATTMGGKGFVRVVVDRPAAARRIFAKHGWKTTEAGLEIIRAAAQADGVVLDPVYTGKAMLGVAHRAAEGALPSRRVVFVHSGGAFGTFPYARWLVP